nr:hypothetical protein [Candidatus Protochlamydia sp.]
MREQIALVVQANACQYCLSVPTRVAKGIGIQNIEITQALHGESNDLKTQAVLTFTKKMIDKRANLTDEDFAQLKQAVFIECSNCGNHSCVLNNLSLEFFRSLGCVKASGLKNNFEGNINQYDPQSYLFNRESFH